jgi:hypothetical protein
VTRLHVVSSTDVLTPDMIDGAGTIREDQPLGDDASLLSLGLLQDSGLERVADRWWDERLLQHASRHHRLPISIYRCGTLLVNRPSSSSSSSSLSSSVLDRSLLCRGGLYNMLHGMAVCGIAPRGLGMGYHAVNVLPADALLKAVLQISAGSRRSAAAAEAMLSSSSSSSVPEWKVYHMTPKESVFSLHEIVVSMLRGGMQLRNLPYVQALREMERLRRFSRHAFFCHLF